MKLIVDAIVAFAAAATPVGFARSSGIDSVAPPLLSFEVVSSLHAAMWRGELPRGQAEPALRRALAASIKRVAPSGLREEAWALADEFGWAKTYDANDVALARAIAHSVKLGENPSVLGAGTGHARGVSVSVLIVDDDPGYRRVADELLDTRGYSVVGHAATGREALTRTDELGPDAVLLDVRLPDGNGIAIAGGLSARSDSPRILLVSTDTDAVSADDLEECGAAGFVAKADLAGADLDRYLKR